MTEAELKAGLMAAMEVEVERLVKWEMRAKSVTFTQIEDEILARREAIGRQMGESVLAHREAMRGAAIPENATTGKRLNPKGKKKDAQNALRRARLRAGVLLRRRSPAGALCVG